MALAPVVVCLSRTGEETARKIADILDCGFHGLARRTESADVMFDNAADHLQSLFVAGTPIIGVCATGILVRVLSPFLSSKSTEPPVLAVAEDGSAVIPLLGGHRGANRIARHLAENLGCHAAVTTAGDVSLGVALDEPPPGWRLANPEHAGAAMADLLAGAGARIEGENVFDLESRPDGRISLVATEQAEPADKGKLVYHPVQFALGVGCSRGCEAGELAALADSVLARSGIAAGSIACVASLDLKADEPAVFELADSLDVPLSLFSAAELEAESHRLANPSEVVFREVGCHGVAEAAALAVSGEAGRLVVEKTRSKNATCALARSRTPIISIPGRRRGSLAIVGLGPGHAEWRTPEATRMIARADEIVGYDSYIDLLGPLAAGCTRTGFSLGQEQERCRYALERAGAGRQVVLVSSGDAGIYAMASLVHELLDRATEGNGLSDAARRVEVVCAPGVSAMQAAAARTGALLGHDFCAISLSDLLTPRDVILRRIRAAAEGDFVIAFYNPSSRQRRGLVGAARDILLEYRPANTPVVLARSLGRPGERLAYVTLAELDAGGTDMLTTVLVGSSRSRSFQVGGRTRVYTPRGYETRGEACSP